MHSIQTMSRQLLFVFLAIPLVQGFGLMSFYPCNYQGQLEPVIKKLKDIKLSVKIHGNPAFYRPDEMYEIDVSTGVPFNYLSVTGVVSSTNQDLNGESKDEFECMHIHTHMHPLPLNNTHFYWMAPSSGSGCVSLIIRASDRHHITMSDVVGYQICEEGTGTSSLADVHTADIVLREDFDSSSSLSDDWNPEHSGVVLSQECGEIMHDNAAVFCSNSRSRNLITASLNLTNAIALQFALGAGHCDASDSHIHVSYRNPSESYVWTSLTTVRTPPSGSIVHVVRIPNQAKTDGAEIKFSEPNSKSGSFVGCWAIDNILISNGGEIPNSIRDNFNPINKNNWLFTPGGSVKAACGSKGNALLFSGSTAPTWVTSRDIDLSDGREEGTPITHMYRIGGSLAKGVCGHQPNEHVRLFNMAGKRSYCSSPTVDLSDKVAATFVLSIGGGNCSKSTSHSNDVHYYTIYNGVKTLVKSFAFNAYRIPREVIVPIPNNARVAGATICFTQKSNRGMTKDVWGMDSFRLVEQPRTHHHVAQFYVNANCNDANALNKIKFQYSTDLGQTWSLLQKECLPETCPGKHAAHHSVYQATIGQGWHRVTIPLPVASLSKRTRFRWYQVPSNVTSQWSIDDVYIGSDEQCPELCNGRGRCSEHGCICDEGYNGDTCDSINSALPDFLSEKFNNDEMPLINKVSGARVSFSCGILGSGKSLVFDGNSPRLLVTKPLNATNLKFLQFTILMGRYSEVGSCQPPNSPGEGVLVQYSTDNQVHWQLLDSIKFDISRIPQIISLYIPQNARRVGLQIRFKQPIRSPQEGSAVWAMDNLLVTSQLFKTAYSQSVNFHLGSLQPYCNKSLVLAFKPDGPDHENQERYAETQSFHITSGYVLQAEIVIGCGDDDRRDNRSTSVIPSRKVLLTELELQFSVDHGKTWALVQELTYPGSAPTIFYHEPSVYHAVQFPYWRRITVMLPQRTWSPSTRLRMAQTKIISPQDSWGINDVYMGPTCPSYCRNHGMCRNGACICDPGFSGQTCFPDHPLSPGVDVTFDDITKLWGSGWEIVGGHIVGPDGVGVGCEPMTSSNFLQFDKEGVRSLVTPDLDTRSGSQIQFYLLIGGGKCAPPSSRANGVLLQYSLDGGVTWWLIQELYYSGYPHSTFIHLDLPGEAKTEHTRFRWWQPSNKGKGQDNWAIDDVIIGERMQSDDPGFNTEVIPPEGLFDDNQLRQSEKQEKDSYFITFSNRGQSEDFCDPKDDSFVFNKLSGDRFASTYDMDLYEGNVIQFQINVACSQNFSYNNPVQLQFSHDSGYSWDVVRHACYPGGRFLTADDMQTHNPQDLTSHLCTGSARELLEPSIYYEGDFDDWTTVVIPLARNIVEEPVRFRWFQSIASAPDQKVPDWAIANIHIGSSCPLYCSGHGLCMTSSEDKKPKCTCDKGYIPNSDASCSPTSPNIAGFRDRFTAESDNFIRPLGGSRGEGCGLEGDSMYFGGEGTRKLETTSLDTTNIRLIQFHLRIGGNSSSCTPPTGRDEGVIFQYSNDNGITWHLIKEFKFDGNYNNELPIRLPIPYQAKTPSTIFRWWQPLQLEGDHRSQWAIDDIIIGRPDLFENGFFDNFENEGTSEDLNSPWYQIIGAHVTNYSGCDGVSRMSDSALLFDDDQVSPQYLETWDYFLLPGSFLQFDLIFGCGSSVVYLQFSSDFGTTWNTVVSDCLPDVDYGCEYGLGSSYRSELNQEWTRHTVNLPSQISGTQARFRWIQPHTLVQIPWSIDNVYLGNGCTWMCGGFGYCELPLDGGEENCRCDAGFNTMPHCQPSESLPAFLSDDFNAPWSDNEYSLVVGANTSTDTMIEKENLEFTRAGVTMLQTKPLNTSVARYLQFEFKQQLSDPDSPVMIQSSVNNGITWSTLRVLFGPLLSFINIKLTNQNQENSVVFRIWSPASKLETRWSLDDLYIGGTTSSCDDYLLEDDFSSGAKDRTWRFHPGGEVGEFCEEDEEEEEDGILRSSIPAKNNPAMSFYQTIGEHSLITNDMCITNQNYVVQFKIKFGCSQVDASSDNSVQLQFSLDDGVTWSLVEQHCHGYDLKSRACHEERHPASIYYPGSFEGWRRVVVPLDNNKHICNSESVRFRWYQGHYLDDLSLHNLPSWAVDEVYIGPGCDQMCNGHGHCVNETCVCQEGFAGDTCCDVEPGFHATFFKEDFQDFKRQQWSHMSGGFVTPATDYCDVTEVVFIQQRYSMNKAGRRMLVTNDIDTREATFVEFYLRQKPAPTSGHFLPVYFQSSTDGGLSWFLIQTFQFNQKDQLYHYAVVFPEPSRSNATRFRWWQPTDMYDSWNMVDWSIDHIVIGGNLDKIQDDFSSSNSETWLALSSSRISDRAQCCVSGGCLTLGVDPNKDCNRIFASTNGVTVTPGTYVLFNLNSDCGTTSSTGCHELFLEFSTDVGKTWQLVQKSCSSDDINCVTNQSPSVFTSDQFTSRINRVVIPLPRATWSPHTRFRWRMPDGNSSLSWTVDDVYVGKECWMACNGQGFCVDGSCRCDSDWTGDFCQEPVLKFPEEIKDVFPSYSQVMASDNYDVIIGANVDDVCGDMGYKNALRFNKNCSRMLVTRHLNSTAADFVQFLFRFGCDAASNQHGLVTVDFTSNNGITWQTLTELHHDEYDSKPGFVNILLPDSAKKNGIQFRWWQSMHDEMKPSDWAIDHLVIGGEKKEKLLSDVFVMDQPLQRAAGLYLDRDDKDMWQFYDNTKPSSFCGRDDVIIGGVTSGLDVSVGTKDFVPEKDFIVQYSIVVLCQDIQKPHQPVHLQYSTDFGDSWRYVVSQCIPSDPDCFGSEMTQPSAAFITPDWRRRTIWLPSYLQGRAVRFRFQQYNSDVVWALDSLYIGPACIDACSGHGICVKNDNENSPTCKCDDGYVAPNCYLGNHLKNYLKATFNIGDERPNQWQVTDGEKFNAECGRLIDGLTVKFDGDASRQIETKDLDLRDARYVQYYASIGHDPSSSKCLPAYHRSEGIILQYSTDGGLSWEMLHELDYLSYNRSKHDYIKLPFDTKSNATRLRWWQPYTIDPKSGLAGMGLDRAGWALDDVYVGGNVVNPSTLTSNFSTSQNPPSTYSMQFDFHPNGIIENDVCGHDKTDAPIMIWLAGNEQSIQQSLTTRQMIVSDGFMIQFKIKVGCDAIVNQCSRRYGVRLQYRNNPGDPTWKLIRGDCSSPSSPSYLSSHCSPLFLERSSVFTLSSSNSWTRVTIMLDHIESSYAQFRWYQPGGAPAQDSWAIEEIYVGEKCPRYCGGHGRCTLDRKCICDPGYKGEDCVHPMHPNYMRNFKENFEHPSPFVASMVSIAMEHGALPQQKWAALKGGDVTHGGCGGLRPYGHGRTAYFHKCGERFLQTVEMDMKSFDAIQYVIQIGSMSSHAKCQVNMTAHQQASVLLQYTTNNGITWEVLMVHRPIHYLRPKRVSVPITRKMKTDHTAIRWWQPFHGVHDQWALDNIEIIAAQEKQYLHNFNAPPPLLPSRERLELPEQMKDGELNIIPTSNSDTLPAEP